MPGDRFQSSRSVLLLTVIIVLSYWKLIFTKQFTTLGQWEIVNQAYTWYTYAARSIQDGIVPLWDPYRFAGNSFIGEMQPGLFYPFKLALYLAPLDGNGLLSERIFNQFYVFSHWLAALLMFALARHLQLGRLSSLVAAICFGLGGYMRVPAWPNIVDAMVWLPLAVLYALRAFHSERVSERLFNACVSGACLGMTLLAGSIHIAIMDAIVIASLAVYLGLTRSGKRVVLSLAGSIAVIALIAGLAGAIQLLPSLEYAPLSYRWYGGNTPVISVEKIPYPVLSQGTNFSAKSLFALLLGEVDAGDSDFTPYFGVMPLILVIIGAWKYWSRPLVRYLTGLAALAFVYTWGGFSLLHGVLYLSPYLDMAREADRFIYLTQFAMSILAGFGVQAIFEDRVRNQSLGLLPLLAILKWTVVIFAIILGASSLRFPVGVTDLTYLSFFFLAASYALLLAVRRGSVSAAAPVLLILLVVWDFYAFSPIDSKIGIRNENRDFHARLVHDRKLADFFKSQPDAARVHFEVPESPNLGHAYGVPLTWAMSATMLIDYTNYLGHARRNQLFNVRYTVRRKDQPSPEPPVYSDDVWNVYENADALPRAWIVHQVEVDTQNNALKRLNDSSFDLRRTAIVDRPLPAAINEKEHRGVDSVQWLSYGPNHLEVQTASDSPGLLVVSEMFYPGWRCEVDGVPAEIYRADGLLRAVPIDSGTHRVAMRYRPVSVLWGAVLSSLTLGGIVCWSIARRIKRA